MAKQINLIVNSCGECPYICYDKSFIGYKCSNPNSEVSYIHDKKFIDIDCPLQQSNDENIKLILYKYYNFLMDNYNGNASEEAIDEFIKRKP